MIMHDAASLKGNSSHEREWLRQQIYTRAISMPGKVTFDFRELLTNAKVCEIAGRLMWQLIKPYHPAVLVGPGFGATPLLYSTALAALSDGVTLDVLMVRDQRKGHNRKRWVEGKKQPPGARAVIIDDFMRKGSALPLVEQALAADKHDLEIAAFALFFDMWQPLGSRQLSLKKFPIVSLFKRHDIGLTRDCYDAAPPLMTGAHPPFLQSRKWWRFDLNHTKSYRTKSVPVISGGAVFVADDQSRIWRHNSETGNIDWQYSSLAQPRKGIVQMLQHADNSLVFGCYDGTVTRLDAATGDLLWRWRLDSSIHATPHLDLVNQRFFINTEQWGGGNPHGHLYACDWKTGQVLWKFRHAYWPPGSPIYCPERQVVVSTCNDLSIIAVDANTGSLIWKNKVHGLVRGKGLIHDGSVYCATETGRLQRFDIKTGNLIWSIRAGAGLHHAFVKQVSGKIVLYDGEKHMSAFDSNSGELCWISRLRDKGTWCPVQYGPYLVALSISGQIAVFDTRSRLKVWEAYRDYLRGEFQQPPALGEGLLAAASNTSGLQVFEINQFYTEQMQ